MRGSGSISWFLGTFIRISRRVLLCYELHVCSFMVCLETPRVSEATWCNITMVCVINRKWCIRKRSWYNLRYYSVICLGGLRKITKIIKIVFVLTKILTGYLLPATRRIDRLHQVARYFTHVRENCSCAAASFELRFKECCLERQMSGCVSGV
jgi:hypothetical protein